LLFLTFQLFVFIVLFVQAIFLFFVLVRIKLGLVSRQVTSSPSMTENIINPLHRLGRVVFGRLHDGIAILGGKRGSGRPAKVLGPERVAFPSWRPPSVQ
jgi:hypothetical protein